MIRRRTTRVNTQLLDELDAEVTKRIATDTLDMLGSSADSTLILARMLIGTLGVQQDAITTIIEEKRQ